MLQHADVDLAESAIGESIAHKRRRHARRRLDWKVPLSIHSTQVLISA